MHRLLLIVLLLPLPAHAQPLADTLFTWQGYGRVSQTHVQLFRTPAGDRRTHTVVLRELAANPGPPTLDDARFVAEAVGRHFGVEASEAYWIFHWGAFSYPGAAARPRKELFLRATFRRNRDGSLGAPQWRLVTREDVEDYTDRLFQ